MARISKIGVAVVTLAFAACSPAAPPAEQAAAPAVAPAPALEPSGPNTLTSAEQAAGWQLLFNGKDLTGWKGYKKDAPGAAWVVEDGTLALTAGGTGDLMTAAEYGPFEMSLEWKISPKGNSGVIYLIHEEPDSVNTYNTGPEMQVLDNDGHADGKIPSHRAGALYDIETPPDGVVKPVGEWNEARIVFTGSKIEHWLNGQKVSESSYGDEAWKKKVAASKFKQWKGFGTYPGGHIALQDHGDKVWYRNIKIKKL
ncbi:MAG TPA: DUF1080 domain-containing protein [Hyphomonadaceae bacterium]|jgi:hypothetical protein|nr:DUF1080 domain-containing protein [Hyphomonadaceae bacterium]